ncbi:TonB-dependent receptor plug domain-containing protein [Flavicella sp.]|uniref:TonB-dependent receptor plug domain-containing protein n=1 Tax=Flavicella sp. TaxID=2957742 RepID=UPI0026164C5C|nr:TonB-dependent receptor plug domain-containing protein [Flavicella sp.]MDG1804747.1 TonB-dependent receptor [Flavicella sp.]
MKYCTILFFLLLTSFGFSQKCSVTGVVNFKNGTPVQLASVFVANSPSYAYSDHAGHFELTGLKLGKNTVYFQYYGKEPEKVTVTVDKEASLLNHTFEFNEENELTEVLVLGKSKEAEIESRGFAVNAISTKASELQSIQAADVLDRSSGVRIRQSGGIGSRMNFNINGLSGNAIRVFIDGVPIESFGPSFSLASIPTNLIERIEVYKGVVPIELAGDALGGAINVVLKKTGNKNKLFASYSLGSFNTDQVSIAGNYYNEKTGFIFRASSFYNYSDNSYRVWGNQVYTTNPTTGDITYLKAKRFHDAYLSVGTKAEVGLMNKSWADELLFGIIYSELDKDIQHGATMESVYGNRNYSQDTRLASLSYRDKSFLSNKKWSVDAFSSYSKLTRKITDTIPYIFDWDGLRKKKYDSEGNFIGYYEYASGAEAGNPTLQTSVEEIAVARVNMSYEINANNKISINHLYNQFTRDSKDPLRHVDIRDREDIRYTKKNIFGVGFNNSSFKNKLTTSVFYKRFHQNIQIVEYKKEGNDPVAYNNINRSVSADGYGITLAYKIAPKILVQTSAENTFRLPVAGELFGNLAESLEPNYDLEPEKSLNLNLGLTLGTYTVGVHDFSFKINTFIRDTKDKIKLNVREDSTDETTEYINDDNYISSGFDLDLFYSFKRKIDFNGNVSVFNSRFKTQFDENGLPYAWYQDRERNAPFFTANGNVRYLTENLFQKKTKTNFTANLGYVHWFYRDWESLGGAGKDIIPTQLVFDVGVTHMFPDQKTSVSFDTRNLFDQQVFDNYALQKPGRAFYLKINYTIF